MKRILGICAGLIALSTIGLYLFLFRPFLEFPEPAGLTCLDTEEGELSALGAPGQIYGLGLSYSGHIAESPGLFDPESGPPIFMKRSHAWNAGDTIPYPGRETMLRAVANLDPEHARILAEEFQEIPPLLDYEVELGLEVQENFLASELDRADFAPPVGFFLANDVTARILIGMAPKFSETVEYLAEGKGLPGFLPVGERLWVPSSPKPDSWLCVELTTRVNGDLRQRASSANIVVGPREILAGVAREFNLRGFKKGDWVITGTPPGVAAQVPGWMQRALVLVDPSAETKVELMIGGAESASGYLRPGDVVTVSAGLLGQKTSRVVGEQAE